MFNKSLLTFSAILFAPQVMANSSISNALNQYYPINYQGCSGILVEDVGYCVKLDSQKTVETRYGKRHYVLVSGDVAFDKNGNEFYGGHVYPGLVGMFVFRQDGNTWQIESANPKLYAGSYSQGLTDWTLHKFAGNTWGFLNRHSDVHQGFYGSHFVILTPNGQGGITNSWVGASFDETASGLCDKKCDAIESTIKIDRYNKVNNYYPLKLTLNGMIEGHHYSNKTYQINYKDSNDGYVAPINYPLRDIDY